MNLPYPHFLVNFKIYPQTIGMRGLEYARTVERVADETGASFVIAPQIPDIRLIAENVALPVTAPYVDPVEPGRGMGYVLLETIKEAGAVGVVINHAEHRDKITDIDFKIDRCRKLGLDSIVCVDNVRMGRSVAELKPNLLIFEKPADISTGRAITRTHPDLVEDFIEAIRGVDPEIRILLGGGISKPEDVRLAFELGADATGAASAVAQAENRYKLLKEFAEEIPRPSEK